MRKIVFVLVLIGVVVISGCAQKKNINTTQTNNQTSTALVGICNGGTGEVNSYTLDVEAESLERVDIIATLSAKCNSIIKCTFENENNLFKLYTTSFDKNIEKRIFDKIDFKAFVSFSEEKDDQNRSTIYIADKKYQIKSINSSSIDIEGKIVKMGEEFVLDNNLTSKFYEYKEENPVIQVLTFTEKDIEEVIVNTDKTQLYKDENGFSRYSILVKISNSSSKRLTELVKNVPIVISVGKTTTAALKSRIYYYANNFILGSLFLPSQIKEEGLNLITIEGVADTSREGIETFNWLLNGLKLNNYPDVKILKKEKIDCRDVI